jgi:glycosyltransferase involved in cell wall biosynthesis
LLFYNKSCIFARKFGFIAFYSYFCNQIEVMRFSIITINYNNCLGLRHTIESVVGQSCADYEYIIIDGGSTDGSVDVIKEYQDKITYWISERDRGIYHAMNKGIMHACGDYCLFLNSGDEFCSPSVLNKVSALISGEDIIVGKVVAKDGHRTLFAPPTREISLYYLYSGTVPHQSSFIKLDLQKKFLYDESLTIVSDWKFFLQSIVMHNCSIKYISVNVSFFDLEGVSTSNPEKMWKEKESVLKEIFPERLLADYQRMKESECLTQTITPWLRKNYFVDKLLYFIGKSLLKIKK